MPAELRTPSPRPGNGAPKSRRPAPTCASRSKRRSNCSTAARRASPSPTATGGWRVNQWLKKAVLLSFRLNDNAVVDGGAAGAPAFDKVPSKFAGWGENRFREAGFRVVPGAVARRGSYHRARAWC